MSDLARVISLPLPEARPRSCFTCRHAISAERTFCTLYEEEILLEGPTAEDCERFDDDPNKD